MFPSKESAISIDNNEIHSMSPKLAFITWYSADAKSAAAFYEHFGIVFTEERHGADPVHFAFQSGGLAIELYPANADPALSGTGTLAGFEIADADKASSVAQANEVEIIEAVKTTATGRRLIVRDPDGRRVLCSLRRKSRSRCSLSAGVKNL